MPRSRDAKVWNEDLVLALRAREEQCRQRCSIRQYTWRDGASAIEAVRKDIYQYKNNGKIVGLPSDLSKTVEDECRAIIDGSKPILPYDYTPTTAEEEDKMSKSTTTLHNPVQNPYHNDPYLKRIKMRGGAYAILMAFHFSRAKTMTKAQLCAAAQIYCDEEMEPNFAAGRSYGAWSSKKTLINHGLVRECRTTQMGRKGYMCNGVFEYSLTNKGSQFTEALLQKFPLQSSRSGTANSFAPSAESLHSNVPESARLPASRKVASTFVDKTVATSKQKCSTRRNKHEKCAITKANNVIDLLSDSDSDFSDADFETQCRLATENNVAKQCNDRQLKKTTRNRSLSSEDSSHGDSSLSIGPVTIKEVGMTIRSRMKTSTSEPVQAILIDDSDGITDFGLETAPVENTNTNIHIESKPVLRSSENILKHSSNPKTRSDTKLVILIDNRERNRNATPRHMRMELMRHLAQPSGSLQSIWPSHMPNGTVDEDQLNYGDFVFLSQKPDNVQRLPVCIERKRISDIVQRSYRADHWKQLARMRDCSDHAILLVEGNTAKTCNFATQFLEYEPKWNPDLHSIDDEHAFYRFLGRAILSSSKLKFMQTKDEQATYRSVGVIGLIAMQISWKKSAPRAVPSSKFEINKLYSKLKSRGIPWQISRRVSEELVSERQLMEMFEQSQSSARSTLLMPIIAHACSSLIEQGRKRGLIEHGTIEGWSSALYHAWFSKLKDPTAIISVYEENKIFADDHGRLLAALHQGKSIDCALLESNIEDENLDFGSLTDLRCSRKVQITTLKQFSKIFPAAADNEAFYNIRMVDESPLGFLLPSVVIQTVSERFESNRMVLCVLEGKDIVCRIKDAVTHRCLSESVTIAESLAKEINLECSSYLLRKHDRRVLIVRGLFPALDDAAKQIGYMTEFKVLADMVVAELMLRHNLATVHACRLANDLEMIIREFAMAAFYYQLTTRKLRQTVV
jgi:ERCC4-type nuclease